jgi:hypothetical protein
MLRRYEQQRVQAQLIRSHYVIAVACSSPTISSYKKPARPFRTGQVRLSFPESSGSDSRRQKQPLFTQHYLNRNRTGTGRSCRPSPRVPCRRGRPGRHASPASRAGSPCGVCSSARKKRPVFEAVAVPDGPPFCEERTGDHVRLPWDNEAGKRAARPSSPHHPLRPVSGPWGLGSLTERGAAESAATLIQITGEPCAATPTSIRRRCSCGRQNP